MDVIKMEYHKREKEMLILHAPLHFLHQFNEILNTITKEDIEEKEIVFIDSELNFKLVDLHKVEQLLMKVLMRIQTINTEQNGEWTD